MTDYVTSSSEQRDFGFLVVLIICLFAIMLLLHSSQDKRLDKIERNLCGFIFEEDGSVSPQVDDRIRYACLNKKR